jgi:putative hydroxymethylpyrimidine transport system permease protein
MTATTGRPARARALRILFLVRVPAALPALASGLRVATAVAPIGAVVGEWVGASAGLGYLMLHANGRMQTDLMFAALFALSVTSVALWYLMDHLLRRLIPWQQESSLDLRPTESLT